jgi:hypothetical protein
MTSLAPGARSGSVHTTWVYTVEPAVMGWVGAAPSVPARDSVSTVVGVIQLASVSVAPALRRGAPGYSTFWPGLVPAALVVWSTPPHPRNSRPAGR